MEESRLVGMVILLGISIGYSVLDAERPVLRSLGEGWKRSPALDGLFCWFWRLVDFFSLGGYIWFKEQRFF